MIEKLTKDLLNKVIDELKEEENQKRIENDIINPVLIKFTNRIFPYIKFIFLIFVLNFILVLIILILIIIFNKKSIIISNV